MLKQRDNSTRYWTIVSDLPVLESRQKAYRDYFINHEIWPELNYQTAQEKIRKQWNYSTKSPGGCRSLENDLQRLFERYDQVRLHEYKARAAIHNGFVCIYSYFDSIVKDHDEGYLSTNDYEKYLKGYHEAILLNKEIGLTVWNQKPIEKIEKEIAKIFLQHQII